MTSGQNTERRRRWCVGTGRVELVAEPLRFERLRTNVVDRVCRLLLTAALAAQLADVAITSVMVGGGGWSERNVVMAGVATNPALGAFVKVGALATLSVIALSRLPLRHARVALGVAATLSAVGPLLNLVQLVGLR